MTFKHPITTTLTFPSPYGDIFLKLKGDFAKQNAQWLFPSPYGDIFLKLQNKGFTINEIINDVSVPLRGYFFEINHDCIHCCR